MVNRPNQNTNIRQTSQTNRSAGLDRASSFARSVIGSSRNIINARTGSISNGQIGPILYSGSQTGSANISTSVRAFNTNQDGTLRIFDINGDKRVSDEEIVDVALTRNFADPGMASAYNSKATEITNYVKSVDKDLNGEVSDVELASAILAARRGEHSTVSADIKNYLLNKNTNRSAIETELNLFDRSTGTGTMADHIIDDLEVLNKLKALRNANTVISATTRSVLKTNPHYNKIEELLRTTNFSQLNLDTEKLDFLLNARKYGVEAVFANELPGNDTDNAKILRLAQKVDADADGVISQKEFVTSYISVYKQGNPEQLDTHFFSNLITNKPSFSSIPAIINRIVDNQGNINETSAITLITGDKSSINLDIVQAASTNPQFKELIGLLKPSAGMSPEELAQERASVALFSNRAGFPTSLNTAVDRLTGTAEYRTAANTIDADNDGIVSNAELRNAVLNNRNGTTSINNTILTNILKSNPKYDDLIKIINIFDAATSRNGSYSDTEMLNGLLEIQDPTLAVNQDDLKVVIGNNTRLSHWQALVKRFDPNSSGDITDEAYATVMTAISNGSQAEIDSDQLAIIEAKVQNKDIIKGAIREFANDIGKDLTPKEVMDKFKPLISTANGQIDSAKLAILSKVIGIIHPGADTLINVYLNFDTDHNDTFTDNEIIKGLLRYNSGQLGKVSNTALNSITSQSAHSEDIKYALGLIDTKGDGNVSDLELINTLTQIERGDFVDDDKFNESIFNQILQSNTNYALANRVMEKFNYTKGFKPTPLDQLASVLVLNRLPTSNSQHVSNADKDNFIGMLGMSGRTTEITAIEAEITRLGTAAFDATGKLKPEVMIDKSILISMGKLEASPALTALLRTNSQYTQITKSFDKYAENKKLTDLSLIKILVDANKVDTTQSQAEITTAAGIKTYFINLLSGDVSGLFADYKASLPTTPVLTDTEITTRLRDELLGITITGATDPRVTSYEKAIRTLDNDHNGKMSSSDFFLHQYYFSNAFNTNNIEYNFNSTGTVNAADQEIFDKVTNYLKINS